jgi:hypothetical protein
MENEYCYYLLYKLNSYHLYWIINVDDTPYFFIKFINKVKSKDEKYYIIKKKVYDLDKELREFKRFTVFLKHKNCEIVRQS